MRWAALALLWTLLPPLARAEEDCASGYDLKFLANWNVSKEDWDKACAQGYNRKEALHALERKSVEQCTDRFLTPATKKKIGETMVQSLCAQGAEGRSRLERLVAPPQAPTPAPIEAPRFPRADEGLGFVGDALVEARHWQDDACLARLHYRYVPRGKEWTQVFEYWFYSAKLRRRRFKATFTESSDASRRDEHEVVDAPEAGPRCAEGVQLDLPSAADRAADAGSALHPAGEPPAQEDFYLDALGGSLKEPRRFACLVRAANREIKPLLGKTYWDVCARGGCLAFDATNGDLLRKKGCSHRD